MKYVDAGEVDLDFALLVKELNLSISAKNNPFVPAAKSLINPDGLGIRRDGTFCVVEVKAVSDCPELYRATIQALCGAVALYAKREMIIGLARTAQGKRPAALSATIKADSPSIGLYVMVDSQNFRLPGTSDFREDIQLLLEAFPAVREVAYFSVDPSSAEFPARIPVTHVVKRNGV